MVHPEHHAVRADDTEPDDRLTPVYPTTEGLHQQTVRRIVARALAALEQETLEDYLAPALASQSLAGAPWPSLADALRYLHSPPRDAATELLYSGRHPASRRIALEELIAQRLSLRRAAASNRTERARPLPTPAARLDAFRAALPFALTRGAASRARRDRRRSRQERADEPAAARRRRLRQDRRGRAGRAGRGRGRAARRP